MKLNNTFPIYAIYDTYTRLTSQIHGNDVARHSVALSSKQLHEHYMAPSMNCVVIGRDEPKRKTSDSILIEAPNIPLLTLY